MTLHGPIGSTSSPSGPVEAPDDVAWAPPGGTEEQAPVTGVVELVTADVPAWRLLAGLVTLIWIYRRRTLIPPALAGALVVAIAQVAGRT